MEIAGKNIAKRHLVEAKISNAHYYNCLFEDIKLDNVSLRDCEFEQCRFVNCSFRTVRLDFFKLIDCEFASCLFQGINISDIMFPCTFSLDHCELRFIDFIGLQLQKTKFLSTNFSDCLFDSTDLRKADFSGSVFYNTEFRQSDLSSCDFSLTEGLELNHDINKISAIKIPLEAGLIILNKMNIVIS